MGSPPKPWERGVATAASAASPTMSSTAATGTTTTVPQRPPAFGTTTTATAMNPSPYGATSPYSRMGSYGGGYGGYGGMGYGGMGYGGMGYGGGYGMGGGYGGMGGGFGGMGYGMPYGTGFGDPNMPSLTQQLESTTQHTFGLLHSIVQTFTGVAQMLESTFMATHSSFFAMVGVVDQFGQLRDALGGVLGLFGLVRWLRGLLTGRRGGAGTGADGGFAGEFKRFAGGEPPRQPINKKPIIVFLLAVLGIPYAMTRLIKLLSEKAQREQQQHAVQGPLDPANLAFARALYPFDPTNQQELALKENEIVAVVGKLDPATGAEVDPRTGVETEWWKGRTRDGREGWFPRKWVEILERKEKKVD
ncbi:Peroxin 13, N-terminal region-domain-containing protein [Armillaria luteobubalina]|uniref:Peroxisomal membrane protein PEX13 n=1 Tax=Armillaria luteobubalina TaxID=153913 RepID=A0AA39QGF4_9AGAR|nr:Peroxin 13, N-terminal region-domain-containing protein [Armillaria luteobubalina]